MVLKTRSQFLGIHVHKIVKSGGVSIEDRPPVNNLECGGGSDKSGVPPSLYKEGTLARPAVPRCPRYARATRPPPPGPLWGRRLGGVVRATRGATSKPQRLGSALRADTTAKVVRSSIGPAPPRSKIGGGGWQGLARYARGPTPRPPRRPLYLKKKFVYVYKIKKNLLRRMSPRIRFPRIRFPRIRFIWT